MQVDIKNNPEVKQLWSQKLNFRVQQLPTGFQYIFIFPYSSDYKQQEQYKIKAPYPYVFRREQQQDITVAHLIKISQQKFSQHKYKNIKLSFSNRRPLKNAINLNEIKLKLGLQNVNGICFYMQLFIRPFIQYDPEQTNETEIFELKDDQCCLLDYQNNLRSIKISQKQIPIKIQIFEEQSYIWVKNQDKGMEVLKSIQQKAKQLFEDQIINIQQLINEKKQIPLDYEQKIADQNINERSKIIVKLKQTQLKRKSYQKCNKTIVIIKDHELQKLQFKHLKFEQIRNMTFKEVYQKYLRPQLSKQKTQVQYCLFILNEIIKYSDIIDKQHKIAKLFEQTKQPITIVGKVVDETKIFYNQMNKIINSGYQFLIDNQLKFKEENKKKIYNQQINKRAIKTDHNYFRNAQRINTIFYYTSQVKCKHKDSKSPDYEILYVSLNAFLRDNHIMYTPQNQIKQQWKYRYSSTLIKHLQKIRVYKGKLHRGVSFTINYKQGQVITYKQFTSASISQKIALNTFSAPASDNIRYLLVLDVESARSIQQYSQYQQQQQQYLIPPYTSFVVSNISDVDKDNVKRIFLKQLPTDKTMPKNIIHFIVWMGHNQQQAKMLFGVVDVPNESCILIFKKTNEQLQKWLNENILIVQSQQTNIIFVTNMVRKQKGVLNQFAGIQSINLIRKYKPEIQICFYIGNAKLNRQKLIQRNISNQKIYFYQQPADVITFIYDNIQKRK